MNLPGYQLKIDPESSHSIILSWLKLLTPGSRILDIGTATGFLGQACSNLNLIVNGIEPVQEWAVAAKPFYNQMFIGEILDAPDTFLSDYSAILCADILEHTPDPEKILHRLYESQKGITLFIVSVPNVANIYIRMSLLFGRFEYSERGILDKTHLRFFTRKSIMDLLNSIDLEILEVYTTPIPLDIVNPYFHTSFIGKTVYKSLKLLTKFLPTVFGYQFVIKAVKNVGK